MGRILRIVAVVILVGVVVVFGWLWTTPGATAFAEGSAVELAAYKGPNPTGVPPELASADIVRRGEYLARAADCAVCHTTQGGKPYAGGYAFNLPFGTVFSPNITPDKDTGIGNYTDAQWLKVMHENVRADGQRLYPAMPVQSYTQMTEADALAIKAYLFTLPAVRQAAKPNTLGWPFNQRTLIGLWNWAFVDEKRFEPVPEQTPEWNRGAYLAEAVGHCGECHTPRNLAMAQDNRAKFAGALAGGWRAHNISSSTEHGIGAWKPEDLYQYLTTGYVPGHGVAAGPMGEVVDYSLKYLTPGDRSAIIAYVRSVPAADGDQPTRVTTPAADAWARGAAGDATRAGERIFAASCLGCHGWTGASPVNPQATLTGLRSINDPSASNVAQVVIQGVHRVDAPGLMLMPAFPAYSDKEVAQVANYVTTRFGAKGSTLDEGDVRKLRQQSAQP